MSLSDTKGQGTRDAFASNTQLRVENSNEADLGPKTIDDTPAPFKPASKPTQIPNPAAASLHSPAKHSNQTLKHSHHPPPLNTTSPLKMPANRPAPPTPVTPRRTYITLVRHPQTPREYEEAQAQLREAGRRGQRCPDGGRLYWNTLCEHGHPVPELKM